MSGPVIVELYDFRQVPVPEKLLELKVSQAAVDEAAASAAERFLTIEPVRGPIRPGDIAVLERPGEGGGSVRLQVNVGLGFAGEALENALLGLCVGDKVPPGQGRVVSVKRRIVPELTDGLVRRLGLEGVSTVDEYRSYAVSQIALRARAGKEKALAAVVLNGVREKSVLNVPDLDNEDCRKLYEGMRRQVEAMAAQNGTSTGAALAAALQMEGQPESACWEALQKRCADMALQAALGREYAARDGVSYTREDALRQLEEFGGQAGVQAQEASEEMLENLIMQSYIRYPQQKIAEYYQDRFHTVLVP